MDNVQKIEDSLWEAAEKLRVDSGLKSTQYSTPLLGLVFLRFASIKYDRFKEEIEAEYNRFKGGRNEKRIEDIALQKCGYYLPPQSHFDYLLSLSESEDIPLAIKKAMEGIEEFKPELVGSLPKEEYLNLEPSTEDDETAAVRDYSLPASLLKIINRIPKDVSGDVFGKVYEYFLGKFASNEGKGGGEYYTPPSVVRLMVEMIEPYKGKILDPACGSGGMFVQSADFVARSNAKPDEIRVYGVERESETVKLSRMNMFIHGLSSEIVQANSYYADPHNCYGDFDYILANPPFNVKDVNYDKVKDDRRFNTFGVPKNKTKAGKKKDSETVPNANYLWINLFATSLNATGRAALVMANGASDAGKSEAEIRSRLVENGIVSCMLSLPSNMFYTVTLPATLWFFDKARCEDKRVLFINACNVYRQIDRTHREFTAEQIANLACIRHLYQGDSTYYNSHVEQYSKKIEELNVALDEALKAKKAVSKEVLKFQEENPDKNLTNVLKKKVEDAAQQVADIEVEIDYFIQQRDWLTDNFPGGVYRDVIGLCKAASIEEIREQDYSLNPGRYVGVSLDVEDRNDFTAAMGELKQTLTSLNDKSQELMNSIMDNLKELGV
ncbi:type I restriction-modification system subunit M [Bacteroides xylanisolvens]|jgi:type I restriction enzyme M protein|uniref:type I restriction-modification system subunit M n=1 Tax=Bacteroides TaxID=816 RepID=UPI000EFDD015|nr:N-6 DNA methylase [Bacteroides caccae]